jgi:hypothetical protein
MSFVVLVPDKRKTLASRRGSWVSRWSSRLAALVPRPTVPPGAGNEAKKASKPEPKRVMKGAKGYVETGVDRHLDTAAIRRHDDGDFPAVLTIQFEQHDLALRFPAAFGAAVFGQSSRLPPCVNRTRRSRSVQRSLQRHGSTHDRRRSGGMKRHPLNERRGELGAGAGAFATGIVSG